MPLSDTTPQAAEVYWRRLREMTPAERLQIAVDLYETAGALQRAALQLRFPHASEDEITFQIAVTRFGPELARKAYGRA